MKLKLIIFLLGVFVFAACGKDDDDKEFGYPDGVETKDMISENDCQLPMCSEKRIVRLTANNTIGEIWIDNTGAEDIYGISYDFTFDSYIRFYLCDLPIEFQKDGLEVIYSGDLLDACGIFNSLFPIEESYILKINKIDKI